MENFKEKCWFCLYLRTNYMLYINGKTLRKIVLRTEVLQENTESLKFQLSKKGKITKNANSGYKS